MKKKIILSLALVFVVALTIISCQKSRYCLCISEEIHRLDTVTYYDNELQQQVTEINEKVNIDTVVVNVDNNMSCKGIAQLGIQKQDAGHFRIDSIWNYTCTKIKKDSIANYPDIHTQQ